MKKRFGTRAEQQEAEKVLGSFGIRRISRFKRWMRKNRTSPDRERVADAALVAFPADNLAELQTIVARTES